MRRPILLIAGLALIAGAASLAWVQRELQRSLPILDGTVRLAGLRSGVVVTRDALGIPVLRGQNREDVARATGFLHAQDRFFQMDVNRRRAAGELAALVGRRALALDTDMRRHRFRAEARAALSLMAPRDRAILQAYASGVNGGLAAMAAPPFEYLLLRQRPQPWRPEDSLLVVLTMFVTLQDSDGSYESALATMRDVLPQQMFDFMAAPGSEWDAPIVGQRASMPPIPGPNVYDLRSRRRLRRNLPLSTSSTPSSDRSRFLQAGRLRLESLQVPFGNWTSGRVHAAGDATGSNNWVISGALTTDGAPLLADDMHLDIQVPNVWYRMQMEWPDVQDSNQPHRLVGVTLAGSPALVAGSNTFVAWGFTNTYADWSDIVLLKVNSADPTLYRTPDGWRRFTTHDEIIDVAGDESVHEAVTWTIWGPVLPPSYGGRPRAYRWVAHAADRLAAAVTPLESARSLEQAFDEANGVGTPGQNMVAADRDGHIGWTIYGSIPRRAGLDGQLPASWSDGARGWNGWLDDREYPRIIDPPSGRIWTANARVVDGDMFAKLGDGGYEIGSRASIIRERLQSRDHFGTADMLAMQLDTRAVFLNRWRDLILDTLTPETTAQRTDRQRFRELVDRSWDGHASPRSVGYRFTRMFRDQVTEAVITFVLSECYEADVNFDHTLLRRREAPVWKLVTERPMHLLDPTYPSWEALLLAAVDDVIAAAREQGDLSDRWWSEYNVTEYRHPLSSSLPLLGRWLNMPAAELPGDLFTVRMQWGAAAASERMVVSPGHEAQGIMHMPTGQSGHPLSPFYRNSHPAWVDGEATPLLAGETEHTLTLTP